MDNTNETEEKKASGFQDSSTSHQKSSEMSSKSYSSPTDNADEEEELEIDLSLIHISEPTRRS